MSSNWFADRYTLLKQQQQNVITTVRDVDGWGMANHIASCWQMITSVSSPAVVSLLLVMASWEGGIR